MKPHSQTLVWLLAAAMAAVDAVAITWLVQAGPTSRAAYLLDALITGQLAVACIWAVFAARRMWSSLTAITIAVLVSSAIDVCGAWLNAGESFGIYASLAGTLVAILWILKQTQLVRSRLARSDSGWQFSIGQVLVVMTLTALVLTAFRSSELLREVELWNALFAYLVCDLLVVVATVIAWVVLPNRLARLATDVAVAGVIGVLLTVAGTMGLLGEYATLSFRQEIVSNMAYTIVISLVLFVWLELAPILPLARRAESTPLAAAVDD